MLFMFSPERPLVILPDVDKDRIVEIIALEKQNYPETVTVSADNEADAIALGEAYFKGEKELSSVKHPNSLGVTIECIK